MNDWYVGQHIVCINDNWTYRRDRGKVKLPLKGLIYTIRTIEWSKGDPTQLAFRVEEIINPIIKYKDGPGEIGFREFRFRPVKKTSIEQFTHLLHSIKEDA